MPEFRLRRKKQNRRTTVNNAEETAKQIQEAKKLVKPVLEVPEEEEPTTTAETHDEVEQNGEIPQEILGVGELEMFDGERRSSVEKRNSFIQEREKFFELLKTKYPEQANSLDVVGVANSLDVVGVANSLDVVGVANSLDVGVVREAVDEAERRSETSLSPDKTPMVSTVVEPTCPSLCEPD